MKKALSLTTLLLMYILAGAQTLIQHGVCYQYNGKNHRTPLPEVTIEYGANSATTISDFNGTFEMFFNGKKHGDRIGWVKVTKPGMMVFNQKTVDDWLILEEPLFIILCDVDKFEHKKASLIAIGKQEAKKKYDYQKEELDKQLKIKQIDNSEYQNKLDKAYEKMTLLVQNLDEHTDLYARIDESEIDSSAQLAMDLLAQRKAEEAVSVFEKGNYLEKLIAQNHILKQLNEQTEVNEQARSLAKAERDKQLKNLKAQVAAYKILCEWEKASALLKSIADELNDLDNAAEYASFCQLNKNYDEAEIYYKKALTFVPFYMDDYPSPYDIVLVPLLYNFAKLYSDTHRPAESEAYYLGALVILRRLAKDNPKAYEPNLVMALNQMANLCSNSQRFNESELYYLEALEIQKRLAKDNPHVNEPLLASILYNLALQYYKTQCLSKSESYMMDCLEIQRRLAKEKPEAYEPDLTYTLYFMGMSYSEQKQYLKAIPYCEESLPIFRKLAQNSPLFKSGYEGTLYSLTQLYSMTGNHTKCYEANEEWLPVLRQYWQENSDKYSEDLINTLGSQSYQCIFLGQLEQGENYAREALKIDPSQHWIITNLAACLLFQGKYAEAEIIYSQYKEELKDSFLQDLNDFETAGVIPTKSHGDVERIRIQLNN